MTIDGDVPFYLSSNEPLALGLAVKDIVRDSYKALGIPPVTVDESTAGLVTAFPPTQPFVVFGSDEGSPWLDATYNLTGCYTGWESHCVRAFPQGGAASGPLGSHPVIVATGTGTRGAMFAAYAYAEELLGVQPLWYWTDLEPAFVGSLDVADTTDVVFAPPKFKFRAPFTNDEDLLGNFRSSPTGETVFDLATWDTLFETALRLKANMFLVGTDPYPDEKSLTLASRRGLAITDHHFDLLGSNTLRWPLGTGDWNMSKDPATMGFMWKASIDAQADFEQCWSVGLRGLNDYAYPCTGDEACAAALSDAMSNQTAWVRAVQPNATIVTYLWDEGLGYLQKGLLRVPEGVSIVFGDEGAGHVHGLGNVSEYASGLYYHTAMLNGEANQLSELVPVSRIFDQIGTFIKLAKQTVYSVINTSDLRPVVMTTLAAFRMLYDPEPWTSGPTPNATAMTFMTDFAETYYGADASLAADIAQWWDDYFHVPYIVAGMADDMLGREGVSRVSQALSRDIRAGGGVSNSTAATAAKAHGNIADSLALWPPLLARAQALAARVPAARQDFFGGHVLVQASIHTHGSAALNSVCSAVTALREGNSSGAAALLSAAESSMMQMFVAERAAEYGKWKGLYQHDRIVDMHRARRTVTDAAAALAGSAKTARPLRTGGGYGFYDYQLEPQWANNFPYLYKNETVNLLTYARVYCAGTHAPGGPSPGCYNTPDGGVFDGPQARIEMADSPYVVRYTTDGSDPTPASTKYSGTPLTITASTSIRAATFGTDGAARGGGITDATFVKRH